jgi:chromosome segregation protein
VYLKRITITGFKSFANKTVLDLEPGITAVVGPNGSGKSNIADAIRWALGEQSKQRLRTQGREEVVFAGTQKRPKASLAEVVLLFDNEDGAFPLDLTEIEISRRLYRSGETDYRLGGRSVRLGDIQQLLAESGFGTNTYAVIGQGMIDTFLLSSPTERKLLFDEAAGIRGSELKREASLRKLSATETNLTRLKDIYTELEPRLASLGQVAEATREQEALEHKLHTVRERLCGGAEAHFGKRQVRLTEEDGKLKAALHELRHELQLLETAQKARLQAAREHEARRATRREKVQVLEKSYGAQMEAVAEGRSRLERFAANLEQLKELGIRAKAVEAEMTVSGARAAELLEELVTNQAAADRAAKAVDRADQVVAKIQANLVEIRQSTGDGTQQQYVAHALSILKTIAQSLNDGNGSPEQLRLLVHKAGRLLSHATKTGEAELLASIRETQARLEAAMMRRETAVEHQTNIIITRRSLEIDLVHQQAQTEQLKQRLEDIQADMAKLEGRREARMTAERELKQAEKRLTELRLELDATRTADAAGRHEGGAAELAEAATQLERLRSQRGATELRLAAVGQELAAVTREQERYQVLAHTWGVAGAAASKPASIDLPELERTVARLEAELETRLGLRQSAEAEFAQVSQRSQDLAAQITDLEHAKADLARVVAELDQLIRERFKQNFTALAGHFSTYFSRLFDGGAASLELEEQEEGEYGIIIKATPKGKRLAHLAALSGGERAMAGVALLAAILKVNPSPFVVLDEVDAALDEANSGRLADILEELSHQSQLIVITHNRQTMKAAKVLFGVTMNEHHVSHLLSLRLEEASALAAR